MNRKILGSSALVAMVMALMPIAAQAQYGGGGAPVFGAIGTGAGTPNPLPGANLSVPSPSTASIVPTGQVLGAAAYSFTGNLHLGSTGADVSALQQFFIDEGYLILSGSSGFFGPLTQAAVMAFQSANGLPSTGYVGPLTIAVLNKGEIPTTPETGQSGSGLTAAQIDAVISMLQSFDADPATVASIKSKLGR